jgi:hypothetical protein
VHIELQQEWEKLMMNFNPKKILPVLLFLSLFCSCNNKDKTPYADKEKIKKIPFLENSDIKYCEKIYRKTLGDCGNLKDCAEIRIEYPQITDTGIVFDSVNQFIRNKINTIINFSDENSSASLQTLDTIADSLFAQYIQIQKDFPDYHTGWFIKGKITLTGIYKNILTLKSEEIVFTGGAHPNSNLFYFNFDLDNGKIIELNDIVDNKISDKLNNIGRTVFCKIKNLNPTKPLNEAGYWFEENKFYLNNNFAITDSGMIFYYNKYEIAPYSMGATELFIPKKHLSNIIKFYNN